MGNLLSRAQLSGYLQQRHGVNYTLGTLGVMAAKSSGPVYRRVGRRAVYDAADVDAWVLSRTSAIPKRSTVSFLINEESGTIAMTRQYTFDPAARRLVTEGEGAAIDGNFVRVVIDTDKLATASQALAALQTLRDYIEAQPWPFGSADGEKVMATCQDHMDRGAPATEPIAPIKK